MSMSMSMGRYAQLMVCPRQPINPSPASQAFHAVLRSWTSKKFASGCFILLPIVITFYITWWIIRFFDGFFSPVYAYLGIRIFGLGFVTSIVFIIMVGVFVSSWVGASIFSLGEWFIRQMPLVRHIYSASKQISAGISPDENNRAFKEVVIIKHPRIEECTFGFITSFLVLQTRAYEKLVSSCPYEKGPVLENGGFLNDGGQEELCSIYVPTNNLYIGDIFLVNSKHIIWPNLSVREGIEIVVSGGTTMPQIISHCG